MNWQFQYKEAVLLFAAVGILLLLFIQVGQWKSKVVRRAGDPALIRELLQRQSPVKVYLRFFLLLLAFSAGILAVMNPRTPGESDNKTRKGIDLAIALDVSKSMLAADLAPNRLERAKQLISKLMNEMPDDRVALVLFAGKAYLQMPLTADHGAASFFVSSVTPDAVPRQGTVISDALRMSAAVFNPAEKRFKSVLLISDGEDHDTEAESTAEDLASQGVMINTVGIGSAEGAPITDPVTGENKKDEAGNTVITKLNEAGLKEIANKTNGVYVHLESSDEAIRAIRAQLAQIERKAFGDVSLMNFTTWYPWLAGFMFILLLIEFIIPETAKKATV